MAGLDTRGFVDGAMQGFGLMDTYYNRQAQNERADKQLGLQEEAFDMQKERHGAEQAKEKATFVLGKIAQGVEPTEDRLDDLISRLDGCFNGRLDGRLDGRHDGRHDS